MDSRKVVWVQTGIVALGQAVCIGVMIGVFVLLGHYDQTVLLGGIFGWLLSVLNFFFMAVGTNLAADKAEKQDVKGGQLTMRLSYMARMVVIFIVLFALVKSGVCNVLTAVLPLVFTRPILFVTEFFRKSGENKA
jgi:hypothetical protein